MNTRSETTDAQPVTKLVTILGRWSYEEGGAVFLGPQTDFPPIGLSVSNVRFVEWG